MSRRYRGVKRRKRQRIIDLYEGRCAYCGSRHENLTIDHMTPRDMGGTNADDNLQPMCGRCNRKKANRMGCEFWPDGRRCGRPAVEVLAFINANINNGALHCCADCLTAHQHEHLLAS